MELVLTDDQEFFRDTTRKFLGSECPIPKVRELRDNQAGFAADYWRQGAALGWMSLLVPQEAGVGQFLVPREADGVTVTPLRSVDLVRRYARIELDGVRVPASAVVGTPGEVADDLEHQVQVAAVVQSAEMVGAADAGFDITLD